MHRKRCLDERLRDEHILNTMSAAHTACSHRPLSNSLPTEYERDRVYEMYFLKGRDYVHALLSTSTFVLIMVGVRVQQLRRVSESELQLCSFVRQGQDPQLI